MAPWLGRSSGSGKAASVKKISRVVILQYSCEMVWDGSDSSGPVKVLERARIGIEPVKCASDHASDWPVTHASDHALIFGALSVYMTLWLGRSSG